MIASFRDKEAARIFAHQRSRRLPETIQQVALRNLRMLSNARELRDRNAHQVEIVDYH